MSFVQEGDIPVQIIDSLTAESKFNKSANSFDIAFLIQNQDETQKDYFHMNVSGDYTRIKNRSGQTCSKVTYDKLVEFGYQGPDFSAWPNQPNVDWAGVQFALKAMVGMTVSAHCERSDCGKYVNVKYLGGGGNAPTAIDPAMLMNMSQQMNGQQPMQQPMQQQQQQVQQQQPQQGQQMQQGAQQQPMQQQQPQQGGNGGFGNNQNQGDQINGGFSN